MSERHAFARSQRRGATAAEAILWRSLRDRQLRKLKFRRQLPLGPYTVDFACIEARLVVELDGPVHDNPEQQAHDRARDAWLIERGFRILRFPNDLILGGSGQLVLDAIQRVIDAPSSDPTSLGHLLPPPALPAEEKGSEKAESVR